MRVLNQDTWRTIFLFPAGSIGVGWGQRLGHRFKTETKKNFHLASESERDGREDLGMLIFEVFGQRIERKTVFIL